MITISTAMAMTNIRRLRRAIDDQVPTMASTMVMSVVIRDSTSPVRVFRKKA